MASDQQNSLVDLEKELTCSVCRQNDAHLDFECPADHPPTGDARHDLTLFTDLRRSSLPSPDTP